MSRMDFKKYMAISLLILFMKIHGMGIQVRIF